MIATRTGKPVSYFTRGAGPGLDASPDLATELGGVAARVRRLASASRLTRSEVEALKLLEVALRQGASLARVIESRQPKTGRLRASDRA